MRLLARIVGWIAGAMLALAVVLVAGLVEQPPAFAELTLQRVRPIALQYGCGPDRRPTG